MAADTAFENRNLINFLAKKFRRDGWRVYSDVFNNIAMYPKAWRGPVPELIIAREAEIIAVCIESEITLKESHALDRWDEIIHDEPAIRLLVVVREKKLCDRSCQLAASKQIPIETMVVKRGSRRTQSRRANLFRRDTRMDFIMIVTAVIIVVTTLILVAPSVRKLLSVYEFYQPFDGERQQELNKRLEQLIR